MLVMWDPLNPKEKDEDTFYNIKTIFKFTLSGKNKDGSDFSTDAFSTKFLTEDREGTVRNYDDFTKENKEIVKSLIEDLVNEIEEEYNVTIDNVDLMVFREEVGWYFMNVPLLS